MTKKSVLQHFTFNADSDDSLNPWSDEESVCFSRLALAVNAFGLDWWHTKTKGEFARFGSRGNGELRAATTLGIIKGKRLLKVKILARVKGIPSIAAIALNPTLVIRIEKFLHTHRNAIREQFKLDTNRSGRWPDQSLDNFVKTTLYKELLNTGDGQRTEKETIEVEKIWEDDELKPTTKMQLINARIGQGIFREEVLKRAGGICEVTGVDNRAMLIASHIHPWAADDATNKDRLDPNNGLSLTPNLDKLFDRGFISFNDEGRLLIKTEDEKLLRQLLPYSSADPVGLIKKPTSEQCVFLAKHREIYKFAEGDTFLLNLIMPSGAKGASKSSRPTARAA